MVVSTVQTRSDPSICSSRSTPTIDLQKTNFLTILSILSPFPKILRRS